MHDHVGDEQRALASEEGHPAQHVAVQEQHQLRLEGRGQACGRQGAGWATVSMSRRCDCAQDHMMARTPSCRMTTVLSLCGLAGLGICRAACWLRARVHTTQQQWYSHPRSDAQHQPAPQPMPPRPSSPQPSLPTLHYARLLLSQRPLAGEGEELAHAVADGGRHLVMHQELVQSLQLAGQLRAGGGGGTSQRARQ